MALGGSLGVLGTAGGALEGAESVGMVILKPCGPMPAVWARPRLDGGRLHSLAADLKGDDPNPPPLRADRRPHPLLTGSNSRRADGRPRPSNGKQKSFYGIAVWNTGMSSRNTKKLVWNTKYQGGSMEYKGGFDGKARSFMEY